MEMGDDGPEISKFPGKRITASPPFYGILAIKKGGTVKRKARNPFALKICKNSLEYRIVNIITENG